MKATAQQTSVTPSKTARSDKLARALKRNMLRRKGAKAVPAASSATQKAVR